MMKHISVLLNETIDGLDIHSGDIVVDGTLGGAGHTMEIIRRFGKDVKIIGIDLDKDAIDRSEIALKDLEKDIILVNDGFQNIDKILENLNLLHADRILLDLGLSSFQLEESKRGFSFLKDEPLMMTMKKPVSPSQGRNPTEYILTAHDIVNTWGEKLLADIIYGFGEEKYSRKIAKAIVEARKEKEIKTTFDLVKIIKETVGRNYRSMKIHPATRTFQALRIATNSELTNLEKVIEKGFDKLTVGGRIAIISFHSLEDRIVKKAFRDLKDKGYAKVITKKPIIPSKEEAKDNPRSRSAKLRLIEKIINKNI